MLLEERKYRERLLSQCQCVPFTLRSYYGEEVKKSSLLHLIVIPQTKLCSPIDLDCVEKALIWIWSLWWFLGIIWVLRENSSIYFYFSYQDMFNWFIAAIRICEHVLLKRDSMRKLSLVRGRRISEANRGMTRSGRWWGFQVESLLKMGRRRVPLFIHPIQSLQDVPEMLNYLSPNLELYGNLRQGGVCVSI